MVDFKINMTENQEGLSYKIHNMLYYNLNFVLRDNGLILDS
jgi:hypothetical protein